MSESRSTIQLISSLDEALTEGLDEQFQNAISNDARPARVYLIQHPDLSVAKIGITGQHTKYDRLSQHEELGWEVLGTWEFATGKESQEVEGTVLSWWRDELEAPQALTTEEMPQRGETETAWLTDVNIDETVAFIERLVAAD